MNYVSKWPGIKNKLYPFESTQILTISARTVTTFYITIKNTEEIKGYIPWLHIGEGIYARVAIVKNFKGKAHIKFATTNEIPVKISIPTITLEEFEEKDSQNVIRQSRHLKNLSDDDLSNKILNSFLKTNNFLTIHANFLT